MTTSISMTTRFTVYSAILVIGGGCLTARALTEQWRYVTRAAVQQIAADGKGGCAYVDKDASNWASVVWLNQKGAVQYATGVLTGSFMGAIINGCSANQLLYTGMIGFPMMAQVDKKGKALPVAAFGGYVLGMPLMMPFGTSLLNDKKGFFVINVNTNTEVNTVVRYLYK